MTTDEALQIVDQAASVAPLNRQAHIAVQEAVATLRVALTPKEEPKQAASSHDGAKEPVPAD
jgi:hypothetical protein